MGMTGSNTGEPLTTDSAGVNANSYYANGTAAVPKPQAIAGHNF
jgi:hypothetical protein